MPRYRSRPQDVEAIPWTGHNLDELLEFDPDLHWDGETLWMAAGLDAAQSYVPVPVGHWIVRQVGRPDDHWPVDPDYFARKYYPLDEEA